MLRGILALFTAIAISSVAGWMSVIGMIALFPSAGLIIIFMMLSLESAKVISVAWLQGNWNNSRVTWFHKTYLVAACIALMIITAIGTFGYLSKSHLLQTAPLATIQIQVDQKQQRITQLSADEKRITDRLGMMDRSVSAFLVTNKARSSMTAQHTQATERQAMQVRLDADDKEINNLTSQLVPLKVHASNVDAGLGPVKYVAELFGWKDSEVAVRFVILILMFAFDPLAIALLIAGVISMGEWNDERKLTKVIATPYPPKDVEEDVEEVELIKSPKPSPAMTIDPGPSLFESSDVEKLFESPSLVEPSPAEPEPEDVAPKEWLDAASLKKK